MIPLIEEEFVDRKGWVSKDEIVNIFAISQTLPGVIAINASLLVGYKIGRKTGALIAAAGMILPSFLIILLIASIFSQYRSISVIQDAFSGIRAGVTALILLAAIRLTRSVIRNRTDFLIATCSLFLVAFFEIHPIIVILLSAFSGIFLFREKAR